MRFSLGLSAYFLFACLLTIFVSSTQAQTRPDSLVMPITQFQYAIDPASYLIRPGQKLRVTFLQSSLPTLELEVNPEGAIVHSSFGRVAVGGDRVTLAELRTRLLAHLSTFFRTQSIDVSVAAPLPVSIDVSGEVVRPGRYRLSNALTLADLIDSAGGILPLGSRRQIQIVGVDSQRVDLARGILTGDLKQNPFLYGIYSVHVPVSGAKVRVEGDVKEPASVEYFPHEQLSDLFPFAGGLVGNEVISVLSGGQAITLPFSMKNAHDVQLFTIVTAEGQAVFVSGAMVSQGHGQYAGRTLADVVASLGGYHQRADTSRIVIWKRILRKADTENNRYPLTYQRAQFAQIVLAAGDSVVVPFRQGFVEIMSNSRVRAIPFRAPISVRDLLASADSQLRLSVSQDLAIRDGATQLESKATLASMLYDGDRLIIMEKEQSK